MSIGRSLVARLAAALFCAVWIGGPAAADDAYYAGPDDAHLAPRSALILGISRYSEAIFPRLPNADTDVERMKDVLQRLGFEIYPKASSGPLTRQQLKMVLYDYVKHIKKVGGASLIYFAGHGVAYGQLGYLVPYDAMAIYSRDLREELIPLDLLSAALSEMSNAFHIVILDACRNPGLGELPPFGSGVIEKATAGVRFDPPTNVVFATSARENQKARDGIRGENSPFARALSNYIQQENRNIDTVFSDVKRDFVDLPPDPENGPQNPTSSNEGGANFFFRPTTQTYQDEKKYWDAIDQTTAGPDVYRNFLKQFPAGYFAARAREMRDRAPSVAINPQSARIVITGDGVRLRALQSETSQIKKTYNKGARGAQIFSSADWMLVQMSDGEIGYVKSNLVAPAPSRDERLVLSYSGDADDPPADLDGLLNRVGISSIEHARIIAHADPTSPGAAAARIVKVQAALAKKGVDQAIIEVARLSAASTPEQLNQVEVTLKVIDSGTVTQ